MSIASKHSTTVANTAVTVNVTTTKSIDFIGVTLPAVTPTGIVYWTYATGGGTAPTPTVGGDDTMPVGNGDCVGVKVGPCTSFEVRFISDTAGIPVSVIGYDT
jgi:hypothetical protein